MTNNNDILVRIQSDLLIPAFDRIRELLEKKNINATVVATDDSRTVSFLGKDGGECTYRSWINPISRPRIYVDFKRPEADHNLEATDYSGAFVDEISPDVIVRVFQNTFRFCT